MDAMKENIITGHLTHPVAGGYKYIVKTHNSACKVM